MFYSSDPNLCTPSVVRNVYMRATTIGCRVLLMVAFWAGSPAEAAQSTPAPPNFIVILADDLGYGDAGAYKDQPIRTPQLDRMANEGVELTQFYGMPVCTPARAALLTGRWPIRSGLTRVLDPGDHLGLPEDELTLAEALRELGYRTACIGKWHLGDRPRFRPSLHGFDSYFGLLYSNDMIFLRPSLRRLKLYRSDRAIESPVDQSTLTQRYTEESIRFIRENRDHPFFLYLAHTMPHFPQHSSAPFRGKSARGPYGDAVEEIDWGVGQIMETLRSLELDDSTLVVFTSDNGPAVGKRLRGGSAGGLRGGKGTTWEGGGRVPFIARWQGRLPPGERRQGLATIMDLFPTLLRLAGGAVPADRTIDGRDLLPLLEGTTGSAHDAFYYFKRKEIFAVREGRWKLHFKKTETGPNGRQPDQLCVPPELYDLESDPGESQSLTERYPEIVSRLHALAEALTHQILDARLPGASSTAR